MDMNFLGGNKDEKKQIGPADEKKQIQGSPEQKKLTGSPEQKKIEGAPDPRQLGPWKNEQPKKVDSPKDVFNKKARKWPKLSSLRAFFMGAAALYILQLTPGTYYKFKGAERVRFTCTGTEAMDDVDGLNKDGTTRIITGIRSDNGERIRMKAQMSMSRGFVEGMDYTVTLQGAEFDKLFPTPEYSRDATSGNANVGFRPERKK